MSNPHRPRIAVLSPGRMGAAIAALFLDKGLAVLTCLDSRGAASHARAAAIRLPAVPRAALADTDLLLSIVPPAAAEALARELIDAGVFRAGGPLFVDCNAVAPDTVRRIDAAIRAAGGRCIDAAIVGGPPQPDGTLAPILYASGAEAPALRVLADYGLEVQVLDAPVGAASALKMCFAAVSKGLTALLTQVALGASAAQVAAPLHAQLLRSLGPTLAWAGRQVPLLPEKSQRWVGEMHEIAHFLRDIPGATHIFQGAAEFYAWLDREQDSAAGPHTALAAFFRT